MSEIPRQVRTWRLAHGRAIELGRRAVVMGILNVTPDSFSDGGRFLDVESACEQAATMLDEGAEIIDIGGESTRPGGPPVTAAEEQARILPVIAAIAERTSALISVDTYRAETARMAIEAGAHIVNDVWGLQRDPEMVGVVALAEAGVVVMHTSRDRALDSDPVRDQHVFLDRSLATARATGIAQDRIVLDPGFGFGKESAELNLTLMRRFEEMHEFGFPLLVGTSRKRFIGTVTGRDAPGRDAGTAATSVILRLSGADIFRVHNVALNADALKVVDAMVAAGMAEETVD